MPVTYSKKGSEICLLLRSTYQNAKITIDDMAGVVGITKRNIEKNIKILKDEGILLRVGGKKEGFWKVVNLLK
jgi:ATP-dependent DNA helicase RecG